MRARRALGRLRRRIRSDAAEPGATRPGEGRPPAALPGLPAARSREEAAARGGGTVLWVSNLHEVPPPRTRFVEALHATLHRRGWRLEVRLTGPKTASPAAVPPMGGLDGAKLKNEQRSPRAALAAGFLAAGGGLNLRAAGRGFSAAGRLPRRAGLLRAAHVAASFRSALAMPPEAPPPPPATPPDGGVRLVILWNAFAEASRAAEAVCRREHLPVLYAHEGVLPGSLVIEAGGQMAESPLARAAGDPHEPPAEALDASRAYLAEVRRGRVTRKPQGVGEDAAASEALLASVRGPVLFYAGQNDEQAGFVPRGLPGARRHSPHFSSTLDALAALQTLARRQRFTVVFKPHPIWIRRHGIDAVQEVLDEEVCCHVPDASVFSCIERASATATIVSQVAYLSLIHGTPALLLGRMPLTGWGCATELIHRAQLPAAVGRAMNGGEPGASAAFVRHVTAARTRFLLPLDPALARHFPRSVEDAADEIIEAAECGPA